MIENSLIRVLLWSRRYALILLSLITFHNLSYADLQPSLKLSKAESAWLNAHNIIRYSGDPNWLPYEAFDAQGNYTGIVAEYLNLIEQRLGIQFKIIPTQSWTESVAKIKQGEIDVLSETIDSDLKNQLQFTKTYLSSPIVIVMQDDADYVDNIEQINQKKIAVIRDYGYVPNILKKHPALNVHRINNIQEGLTKISTGKVDVLLATLAQASYHISELGINNIRIVGKSEFNTQLAFGMRPEYSPLIPLFNRAIDDITHTEKQTILDRWGKHKFAAKTDYTLLAKIAAILIFINALFFYWNRKLKIKEAQLKSIIDALPLAVVIADSSGTILLANPQASKEIADNLNLVGRNTFEFYANPQEKGKILEILKKNGAISHRQVEYKIAPNKTIDCLLSIHPIRYQNKNAWLAVVINLTERIKIQEQLADAKEQAEQASKAKSEFLANMSHEIRTPMNAIIGFTELLVEQVKEPRLKGFVNTIHSAGNTLLILINDILDLSKIEAGKMAIAKTAINPHELFTEIGNIFMMDIQKKDLNLILEVDPKIPASLILDATRLRQVLLNLVGNAVKFTEQGHIRLRAKTSNEDNIHSLLDLLIEVEDTGIGIPEKQQKQIFTEFTQSEGQDPQKFGGTGLGLSISRRLTELMGGTLSVVSKVGYGSTFTVNLAQVSVASVKANTQLKADGFTTTTVQFMPAVILVVDDIANNRQLICENFISTELTVIEACNGQEAVDIATQQAIDLIIMDIRMPVMNGYQAAEQIRAVKNIPIIALTASVMTEDFERIKSDNFDAYLKKPVLRSNLFTTMAKFLEHQVMELDNCKKQTSEPQFSKQERKVIPEVLARLKLQIDQWQLIQENNNISEITKFATDLTLIADDYNFQPLLLYGQELSECINAFDIGGIKQVLNQFPDLQDHLEQAVVNY